MHAGALVVPPDERDHGWMRNRQEIPGATGTSYVVRDEDVASGISCFEIAENAAGKGGAESNSLIVGREGTGTPPQSGGGITPVFPTPVQAAGPSSASQDCRTTAAKRLRSLLGRVPQIRALLKAGSHRARFAAPCAARLEVRWYGPRSRRAPPVLVARGTRAYARQGTATIAIKLTAKGRRLLARARRIRLAAAGIFTPKGGTTIKASRAILLRP